jgi:hypothetical protein
MRMRWPIGLKALPAALLLLGCSEVRRAPEPLCVVAAKQEARRRGWHRFEVGNYALRGDVWEVFIWKLPKRVGGGNAAWVKVAPDGTVVSFYVNPM